MMGHSPRCYIPSIHQQVPEKNIFDFFFYHIWARLTWTIYTRRNIYIGIPLNLSMSGKWNEVPKWSGVTVSQLIYIYTNVGSHSLIMHHMKFDIVSEMFENGGRQELRIRTIHVSYFSNNAVYVYSRIKVIRCLYWLVMHF